MSKQDEEMRIGSDEKLSRDEGCKVLAEARHPNPECSQSRTVSAAMKHWRLNALDDAETSLMLASDQGASVQTTYMILAGPAMHCDVISTAPKLKQRSLVITYLLSDLPLRPMSLPNAYVTDRPYPVTCHDGLQQQAHRPAMIRRNRMSSSYLRYQHLISACRQRGVLA